MAGQLNVMGSTPSTESAFWKGRGGKLWRSISQGAGWGPAAAMPLGAIGTKLAAVGQSNGVVDVFWRGPNHHLWHSRFYPRTLVLDPPARSRRERALMSSPPAGPPARPAAAAARRAPPEMGGLPRWRGVGRVSPMRSFSRRQAGNLGRYGRERPAPDGALWLRPACSRDSVARIAAWRPPACAARAS